MSRTALVLCAIVVFGAALIGCGRKPNQHAGTQLVKPQTTTSGPPKSGYHYPNLPDNLSSVHSRGEAKVLHEAATQEEILKWAKDNSFLDSLTVTATTLEGEWTVVVDDPLSGACAYEPFVYGRCPASPLDPKPWKLLCVGYYQPHDMNNLMPRFRFDTGSKSLVAENPKGKIVWKMDISAEIKLMRERSVH